VSPLVGQCSFARHDVEFNAKFPCRRRLVSSLVVNEQIRIVQCSLIALGLEQHDATLLIVGHSEQAVRDRLNSLRYVRVRRGKQNPIKAFFTYGSVPDLSLSPWYIVPDRFDVKHLYTNGLREKADVVFPSWFRLVCVTMDSLVFFLALVCVLSCSSRTNDRDNYSNGIRHHRRRRHQQRVSAPCPNNSIVHRRRPSMLLSKGNRRIHEQHHRRKFYNRFICFIC
jgi:hypothetical protein